MAMKTILSAILVATVVCVGSADTIAWYHFDELTPGSQSNKSTTFANAADQTKYVGRAVTYKGSTVTDDSWLYPRGVAGLPTGWRIHDPITGATYLSGNALSFCPNNLSQTHWTGTVTIDDDGSLQTRSFTVEMFVKKVEWHAGQADEAHDTLEQMLVSKPIQMTSNAPTYVIKFCANGRVYGGVTCTESDGAGGQKPKYVELTNETLIGNDGKWHHVALTYDGGTRTACLYVDYRQTVSKVLPTDILWGTCPVVVGHNPGISWGGAGIFHGDDLRLSDTVLAPEQFLQGESDADSKVLPVLDETVVYQRFRQSAYEDAFGRIGYFENEAPAAVSFGRPTICSYGETPTCSVDVAASSLSLGDFGPTCLNDGSLSLRANDSHSSEKKWATNWNWPSAPVALSSDDFTAEMILRFPTKQSAQVYLMTQKGSWYLSSNSACHLCVNWKEASNSIRLDDGKWHHVAIVYVKDDENPTLKAYIDYKLVKTWVKGGDINLPLSASNAGLTVGAYELNYVNETFRDIDLDEIRITRKALDVGQMLHPSDGKSYFRAEFKSTDLANKVTCFEGNVPDFSSCRCTLTNAVPAAQVAEGPLAEPEANLGALAFTHATQSYGFVYGDPERKIGQSSFTLELQYRVEPGASAAFKDDCVYLACLQSCFYVRLNRAESGSAGNIRFCNADWKDIASVSGNVASEGVWHHVAIVNDVENKQTRTYFDYKLVGAQNSALTCGSAATALYMGCGCWSLGGYNFGQALLDNVRVTKGALKPCEFLTSRHVDGDSLVWLPFDGSGEPVESYADVPVFTVSGAFVHGTAGRVVDAQENPIRDNRGSLRLASGGATYGRLSLLERKDQTVEFFLKGTSASGTDLVALVGADDANPIWSLRNVNGTLKVIANGNEILSAGEQPTQWAHFAITFEPSADCTSTTVSVYRDHVLFATSAAFAGTLAVDGLASSSLVFGAFDGQVDEFRVSRGALDIADLLYGLKIGFFVIAR